MPFVERDGSGDVKTTYNRPQPGGATEFLRDDSPDYITFKDALDARRAQGEAERAENAKIGNPVAALRIVINEIAALPGVRTAQFQALLARLNG